MKCPLIPHHGSAWYCHRLLPIFLSQFIARPATSVTSHFSLRHFTLTIWDIPKFSQDESYAFAVHRRKRLYAAGYHPSPCAISGRSCFVLHQQSSAHPDDRTRLWISNSTLSSQGLPSTRLASKSCIRHRLSGSTGHDSKPFSPSSPAGLFVTDSSVQLDLTPSPHLTPSIE